MKLSSRAKNLINGTLNKFNLELSTRTASTLERERVGKLISDGYFDRAAFPLLKVFSSFDAGPIIHGYTQHREDCRRLLAATEDPRHYDPVNNYFSPADACPTYLVARIFRPKTWFEIGSGNSTRVVRQAISDGNLATNLICVDPYPRVDVSTVASEVIRAEVQTMPVHSIVDRLNRNDVLFIDSSHELKAGGDVTYLLLNVIPKLRPGVIVHIHDVFLPYDYPRHWVQEYPTWDEQYVVQAMLQFGSSLDVVWPGYYVQENRPEISSMLDFLTQGRAQSLWLRVADSQAPFP